MAAKMQTARSVRSIVLPAEESGHKSTTCVLQQLSFVTNVTRTDVECSLFVCLSLSSAILIVAELN